MMRACMDDEEKRKEENLPANGGEPTKEVDITQKRVFFGHAECPCMCCVVLWEKKRGKSIRGMLMD